MLQQQLKPTGRDVSSTTSLLGSRILDDRCCGLSLDNQFLDDVNTDSGFSFSFCIFAFFCMILSLVNKDSDVVQKKCNGIDVLSGRILICPQSQVPGLKDFAL